jgi:hypothetical protein
VKICRTCHVTKPLTEFYQNLNYPDGKKSSCRTCCLAYETKRRRAAGAQPYPLFLDRLWNSIQQCGHGETCLYCCWPYLKTRDKKGYGRISLTVRGKTRPYLVTRIVFEIWHATPLPAHRLVLHHCDYPPCNNPLHLFSGTKRDNALDCVRKGRANNLHGERHPHTKLTNAAVQHMRTLHAEGMSVGALTRLYHMASHSIRCIINRKTWKHI